MKKILLTLVGLIALYFVAPTHVKNGLIYVFADVDDYKIFPNHLIVRSNKPETWIEDPGYNKQQPDTNLLRFFDDRKTCAFLVIKNRNLIYERYAENYSKETISGSFSMAKTVNALLIGKLLQLGKIKSLDDDIKRYVPELKQIPSGKISLRNVLTMSANIDWSESYWNIFSLTAESYYGNDLDKLMEKLCLRNNNRQGKEWEYQSCCTQILGYVIRNTTKKSIAENAKVYLWDPLGAESDALWSTDKNGVEKSFCCLNATARDFAKLGQLVLQHGQWNGVQLFDSAYISQMETPQTNLVDNLNHNCDWYGFQTWIINYKGHQIPYFRGILGQFIFVIPDQNAVIVRLGKKVKRNLKDPHYQNDDIRNYIEAGLQVIGK